MDLKQLIQRMSDNSDRIRRLAQGVSDNQARWKPDVESWSILEVINHLYDEEREDFRPRVDIMLHRPAEKWSPIDPQGWVVSRNYNEREFASSLQNFLDERQASLHWLETLGTPNWEATYETPFGLMKAGDMMASWVAHDLLHLRQLVELHRAYTIDMVTPYQVDYAGQW